MKENRKNRLKKKGNEQKKILKRGNKFFIDHNFFFKKKG